MFVFGLDRCVSNKFKTRIYKVVTKKLLFFSPQETVKVGRQHSKLFKIFVERRYKLFVRRYGLCFQVSSIYIFVEYVKRTSELRYSW